MMHHNQRIHGGFFFQRKVPYFILFPHKNQIFCCLKSHDIFVEKNPQKLRKVWRKIRKNCQLVLSWFGGKLSKQALKSSAQRLFDLSNVNLSKLLDRLQSKKSKSSSDVTATSSVRKDKYWQVLQQRFTDNDRQGQNVSQKAKERKFLPVGSEVVIQDPFELNHNVSKGIGDVGLANWINHCKGSRCCVSHLS